MKLSDQQHLFISQGAMKRKRMANIVERVITKKPQHLYVFSDPGLGKTFTIENVLETNSDTVEFVSIKGNTSLWGFTTDIAMIDYYRDKSKQMLVFIDDCDNLLQQTDSINTMKIALADNKLKYGKSLGAQYNQLDEEQQLVIDAYRVEGRTGIEIDLTNLIFIWASNYKLADVQDYTDKTSDNKRQKMLHEEALRRRMMVHDAVMDPMIKWGWVADCILNTTPPSMANAPQEDLIEIVDWMYSNWEKLKEHNISVAEKLYDEKELDSDGYKTSWELDYLV